jgi:sugar lactone lactonase YvrE
MSIRPLFRFAIAPVLALSLAACSDDGANPLVGGESAGGQGEGGEVAQGGDAAEGGNSDGGAAAGGAPEGGSGGAPEKPIELQDSYPLDAQFPEGGTYDPESGTFYFGSLFDGSVHALDATGDESVLFSESAAGTWWTLGMDVDVARQRLWVCAMNDDDDPRSGHIWIFDLESGDRLHAYDLRDAAEDASCTDVAVTSDGLAYVTDREQGYIYVVDEDLGPEVFTYSEDLEAALVGQNSLVVLPDESALLSILYSPSSLARIDLVTGEVSEVEIDGKFSDFSFLAGADGMAYRDGSVYVAFTSVLIRVTPSFSDWSQATSEYEDVPSGMTDVISTPGGLYLLNGQAIRFALGNDPDPFMLNRYTGTL